MQDVLYATEQPDGSMLISIRYEGGDASAHTIDLHQLGQSLQGFARILAVCAHLAETGSYNKQFESLSVRVMAAPVQEHHCYEVLAWVQKVSTNLGLLSGLGTAAVVGLVGYVFNYRKGQEMKHLSEALKQSLGQNAVIQERLLGTIERMAEALQASAKQALSPVGRSVENISLRPAGGDDDTVVLDSQTKEALLADQSSITSVRPFSGVISELDMLSGACKVSLDGDAENRIAAEIRDPLFRMPNNPYATAMAGLRPIQFFAKALLNADGEVVRLFISDIDQV